MLKLTKISGILAAGVVALMWALPAQAQATRTWISGVGDDVNPCSRTAPCKTFAGAISKTAAGGEIDTLDPGGFGAVTVTKAITLANEGIGEAGILVAGTNGVTVNCVSDANCVAVILRGLQIRRRPGRVQTALPAWKFLAGRALEIQNCTIRNFTGGSPNGFGVSFTPVAGTGSVTQTLTITDSTFTTNGAGSGGSGTGAALSVAPTGNGNVNVNLDRLLIFNNAQGVTFNSTGMSGGQITATVANSTFASSQTGLTTSGTVPVFTTLIRSAVSNNAGFGIITAGSGSAAEVRLLDDHRQRHQRAAGGRFAALLWQQPDRRQHDQHPAGHDAAALGARVSTRRRAPGRRYPPGAFFFAAIPRCPRRSDGALRGGFGKPPNHKRRKPRNTCAASG